MVFHTLCYIWGSSVGGRDEGEPHLPEIGVGGWEVGLEKFYTLVVFQVSLKGWLGRQQVPTFRQREGQELRRRM